jgi:Bacteriophage baseplate protein W
MSGHIGFPLRLDGNGRTRLADEEEYLRGLVEQVLFTRPGERVNRPDFGTGIDALVFAPTGDEFAHATQSLVQGALQQFLGDLIRVEQVSVTVRDTTLEVTVVYSPLRGPGEQSRTIVVSGGGP